ncbi:MAG: hypothetical protein J6S73_00625 [Lentisphaeria bacterium]|nr:hypothetical protein [Lentisphaeria bacterium]
MKLRSVGSGLLIAVLLVFFAVFLVLPVYTVAKDGLDPALLTEIFNNFLYREGLLNSLGIALVTTLLVILITLPPALLY